MTIKVLDCTLRDGGYYNNWDFDDDFVQKYLSAMATARIDIVEIGFRFFSQNKFMGAFAFTSDEFLETLTLPEELSFAVMLNAKDIIEFDRGIDSAVGKLFSAAENSPIDLVRIACHTKDVSNCVEIVSILKNMGYQVALNLMQITSVGEEDLYQMVKEIDEWGLVDVLYFADSFGSLDTEGVSAIVRTMQRGWKGEIGIHAHDNKNLALSNCIAAANLGVNYLDSTLLGMGRGAGNVKSENLLVELSQRGDHNYFPDALYSLVLNDVHELQTEFGWGSNIYYYLAAVHGIHPTYIQEMLGSSLYSTEQILSSINYLKTTTAPNFSLENMIRSMSGVIGNENGQWDATDWAAGQSVLILGAGPGTKRYLKAIREYVERKNPIVFCLNINEDVPEDLITAYVACHEVRILIESGLYQKLNKPLILPMGRVPEGIMNLDSKLCVFDYGLRLEEDSFTINANGCVLARPLSLAYAISIATASGANEIFLAGMDGYEESDPRQKEIEDTILRYSKQHSALPLVAVTPTKLPIRIRSLYEPDL